MFWERVGERLQPVWHALLGLPRPALAVVILLLFFSPILLPLLLGSVVQRVIAPLVRRGRGEGAYRRRRGPPILRILLVTALLAGGVELWSRLGFSPLIYGEGPVPRRVDRIAYDLTVQPDGALLVSEEIAVQTGRDSRSLFRPLRRDQPVTVLSLTQDDRPIDARVWVGPQYGIRFGHGTPAGRHVYRLMYRLDGAVRDKTVTPGQVSLPGYSYCLQQPCTPMAVQQVRWRPITWRHDGIETFTWHFPTAYTYDRFRSLNPSYGWASVNGAPADEHTLRFSTSFSGYVQTPEWVFTLTLPADMTAVTVPPRPWRPSLPVVAVPVAALIAVVVTRLRIGGRPGGLGTLKAEYTPPDGLSPAELGELVGARPEALTAAAIAHGCASGVLRVDRLRHPLPLLPDQADDEFVQIGPPAALPPAERGLVQSLLHGQGRMRLSQLVRRSGTFGESLETAAHRQLSEAGYYNRRRERQRLVGWLVAAVLLVGGPYAMFFLGNQEPGLLPVSGGGPEALAFTRIALFAWLATATIVALYAATIPTMTRKGAVARSRAHGFAEYLRTAELGPVLLELDHGRAARYLGYATVFGMVPALIERWRGLSVNGGERDTMAGTVGTPRFGDDNVERQTLLAGTARSVAPVGEREATP